LAPRPTTSYRPAGAVAGLCDLRKTLLRGEFARLYLPAGTMVQEVYDTHPAIRRPCNRSISGHAATLLADIEERCGQRGMRPKWTAESLVSTPRPPSRARSSWPRPGVVLRLRRSALIICGDTSSCCSTIGGFAPPGPSGIRNSPETAPKGETTLTESWKGGWT